MKRMFTTNPRPEGPTNNVGEVPAAADDWRIAVYVPDTAVRLALTAAARGTDYDFTSQTGPLRIDADAQDRLSLDDGNNIVRPITRGARMVTRTDVAANASIAAGIVEAVGAIADVDHLGFDGDFEPIEAVCRSCGMTVVIGPACVVCGDANPHAPEADPAASTLFDAPRLPNPEYV